MSKRESFRGVHADDVVEVDQVRSMNAEERVRIETRFELGERQADQELPRACEDDRVVVGRLDSLDRRHAHWHDPARLAQEQAWRAEVGSRDGENVAVDAFLENGACTFRRPAESLPAERFEQVVDGAELERRNREPVGTRW